MRQLCNDCPLSAWDVDLFSWNWTSPVGRSQGFSLSQQPCWLLSEQCNPPHHCPGCAPRPGAGCSCSPLALGQLCLHLRVFADHSQMETISHPSNFPRPLSTCVSSTLGVSISLSVKEITVPTSKGGCKIVTQASVTFYKNLPIYFLGRFLKAGTLCCVTTCPLLIAQHLARLRQ